MSPPRPDDSFEILDKPGPGGKPSATARPRRAGRRQFGLRHLMILSVMLALAFASIAQAIRTGSEVDQVVAVVVTGLDLAAFGFLLTQRMTRGASIGWALICVGPTATSVALIGSYVNYSPFVLVPVVLYQLPVILGVLVHLVGRRRAAQQEATLWVLALTAERGRPLGPAIAALAEQSTGVHRRRARQLAECLDEGMPLPDALDFVPGSAPAAARVIVRVGHDAGRLPEALADAASGRSARPPGWQAFGSRVGYLCMVLLVLQAIVAFILYFITPRFEAIFRDYGMDLPRVTIGIIILSHWATGGFMLPALAVTEGLILVYLPFAFGGYANLHVPLLDRLFLRRHSVLILRCLAMTVEGNRPIGLGLQILARWYPTGWVRERLAGAHLATEGGHDWIEALRHFALIGRSDVALLESARRAGNLPWALRELAEGGARRLGYRLQVTYQVFFTMAMLTVGGFVGFAAVAFFYPLIALIERLAG